MWTTTPVARMADAHIRRVSASGGWFVLCVGRALEPAPMKTYLRFVVLLLTLGATAGNGLAQTSSVTLPPGFTVTQVASGLSETIAMAFSPDGRLFVCERRGRLRVIKNSVLL